MPELKVVVLGNSGVGKSSFIQKLWNGTFQVLRVPTREVEVYPVVLTTNRGPIKLNMWDTVGDAKEVDLKILLQAECAIIMYDATHTSSTSGRVLHWKSDIKRVCGPIPIAVAGNKCDVRRQKKKPLTSSDDYRGLGHFCTSSLTNTNLKETLLYLVQQKTGDRTIHIVDPVYLEEEKQRWMAVAEAAAKAAAIPLPESDNQAAIPLPESDDKDDISLWTPYYMVYKQVKHQTSIAFV